MLYLLLAKHSVTFAHQIDDLTHAKSLNRKGFHMHKLLLILLFWSTCTRIYDGHEDAEEIEETDNEETDNEEQMILDEEIILQRKRGPIKFK